MSVYVYGQVAVSDGRACRLLSEAELEAAPQLAHPALYTLAPPPAMDHDEAFFFDCNGHLGHRR